MVATIEAVQRELMVNGFVIRYRNDSGVDGLPGQEGTFLPCSLWLVSCLALLGRTDEAREIFERVTRPWPTTSACSPRSTTRRTVAWSATSRRPSRTWPSSMPPGCWRPRSKLSKPPLRPHRLPGRDLRPHNLRREHLRRALSKRQGRPSERAELAVPGGVWGQTDLGTPWPVLVTLEQLAMGGGFWCLGWLVLLAGLFGRCNRTTDRSSRRLAWCSTNRLTPRSQ